MPKNASQAEQLNPVVRWTLWLIIVGPCGYLIASLAIGLNNMAIVPFWNIDRIAEFMVPICLLHMLSFLFPKHYNYVWGVAFAIHLAALGFFWASYQPGNFLVLLAKGVSVTWPGFLFSLIGGVFFARHLDLAIYPKLSTNEVRTS